MERIGTIERNTKETQIKLSLQLDGTGKSDISTGIGFFDHMLEGFSKHGFFDLSVHAKGDLHVDGHHTVEDVGIVLGQAIRPAERIFPLTESFRQNASAILKRSLSRNFSMLWQAMPR